MKEKKLDKLDLLKIKDLAKNNWLNKGQYGDLNLCKAYTEAVITYLSSKNIDVINGKLYEKDDN